MRYEREVFEDKRTKMMRERGLRREHKKEGGDQRERETESDGRICIIVSW